MRRSFYLLAPLLSLLVSSVARGAPPQTSPAANAGADHPGTTGSGSNGGAPKSTFAFLAAPNLDLPAPSTCDWPKAREDREDTRRFTTWPITTSLVTAELSLATATMSGLGYFSGLATDAPALRDRAGVVFKYSIPVAIS